MVTETPTARQAYETWHDGLSVDSESESPWHVLLKQHVNHARDFVGKRVLEIACGRGGLVCWLAGQTQRPSQIVAADFAASAVRKGEEFATRRGISGVRWEVSDIQAIPHPDDCFDTVISCETIEHVPAPRAAIRARRRDRSSNPRRRTRWGDDCRYRRRRRREARSWRR